MVFRYLDKVRIIDSGMIEGMWYSIIRLFCTLGM